MTHANEALSEMTQTVIDPYAIYPPGVEGQPMAFRQGVGRFEAPNPHILRGEMDMEVTPVTFNKYATDQTHQVQLFSGYMAIPRNYQRLSSQYRRAGWLGAVIPIEPGRMHGGQMAGGFAPKGPAPSQVQLAFNATAGNQPNYPGGPGQKIIGVTFSNPGTGA